ncbi:unnamed protein product, partial [Rotaria sordida]
IQLKKKDHLIIKKLQIQYNSKLKDLINQLDENIKETKNKIKKLKFKGKHILFKIDIESLNSSYIISKNKINQLNLSSLNDIQSNTTTNSNHELLLNQDLSSLTNNYKSVLYNSKNKQYEPILLNQYFLELNNLKEHKKSLTEIKNKIYQINIDTFVNDSCLEYGNEELIYQKLSKFDKIIVFNNLATTKEFESFEINHFIKQNDLLIDQSIEYKNYLTNFFQNEPTYVKMVEEITYILIESKIPIERIKKSESFLSLLFNILKEDKISKQFQLIECTPIYHHSNESLIHPIEQLIYQFLESTDKSIELLARILQCFREIIEHDQEEILCKTKIVIY